MDTDTAYMAGFFDGEGSVGIFFNNQSTYYIKAQVSQNVIEPLVFIYNKYGGVFAQRQNASGPFHTLVLNGKKCKPFLEDILPFLIVKKELVQLALTFFSVPTADRAELHGKIRTMNALRGRKV